MDKFLLRSQKRGGGSANAADHDAGGPSPLDMPAESVMMEYMKTIKQKVDDSISFSMDKTVCNRVTGSWPFDSMTVIPPDPVISYRKRISDKPFLDRTLFYRKVVHVWCPEFFSYKDFLVDNRVVVRCPYCAGGNAASKGWGDIVKACGMDDTEYIMTRRYALYQFIMMYASSL